ncbi:uncharacterized protein CDAR_465321 [Caerostris darwini]|uniref:C2H2-type domain-containing protein n=1 Tax=Caerostris darwini TaxID=1538125 RepID=A0AAV4SLB1_9ARAC|nr:uncharacterized protein CDAR_465321 [Caerostris darwini]
MLAHRPSRFNLITPPIIRHTHRPQRKCEKKWGGDGALHGGGMMYDSNMYSSPLSLLQLPASALPEVTGRLTQPGNSVARFSQDGKSLSDLRSLVPEADFRQASEVTVDVGFVCKKCHMVYPAEVLCLNHQRASCFQNKPVSEIKATLKLVQCHVECRACRERFTTIIDFKFHCDMDRHMKRVQKIQREATAAAVATSVANHFANQMALGPVTNPSLNNTFANDGNASAAGLLGRNGMMPDMAQLFFSGMGMDSIRLGMGLDPESNDAKSKAQQAVGCGVDAGVSIS